MPGRMAPMPVWSALATLLLLGQYGVFALLVGRARRRTGVHAPTMTGPPELERAIRVHLNTLEMLAIVLPLTWIAAFFYGDVPAAAAAAAFAVSRVAFAVGYLEHPKKRVVGALAGDVCIVLLVGLVVAGVLRFM